MHDLDDGAAGGAFRMFRCVESHAIECHAIDRLSIPSPYATKQRHWTYPVMGSRERTAPRLGSYGSAAWRGRVRKYLTAVAFFLSFCGSLALF